jgi:hypothetical protein
MGRIVTEVRRDFALKAHIRPPPHFNYSATFRKSRFSGAAGRVPTRRDFSSLKKPQIVIEKWRAEYNTTRPHSSLGYRPPAPAACNPYASIWRYAELTRRSSAPTLFQNLSTKSLEHIYAQESRPIFFA